MSRTMLLGDGRGVGSLPIGKLCLVWLLGVCVCSQALGVQESGESGKAEVPRPLSVQPLSERTYPEDRPSWISDPPELSGRVHRWPINSAPSLTTDKADEDLYEQARAVTRAYIRDQLPEASPQFISELEMNKEWLDALMDESKQYHGPVTTPDGEWFESATELVFTSEFREQLRKHQAAVIVGHRMGGLVGFAGFAAISLASLSTILRIAGGRRRS